MTVPFAKHQLSPVFPDNFTAHSAREDAIRVAGASRGRTNGLARQIVRAVEGLRGLGARSRTLNELNQLSDRELADIGLSRTDIPRVFDADFAAEHAGRG